MADSFRLIVACTRYKRVDIREERRVWEKVKKTRRKVGKIKIKTFLLKLMKNLAVNLETQGEWAVWKKGNKLRLDKEGGQEGGRMCICSAGESQWSRRAFFFFFGCTGSKWLCRRLSLWGPAWDNQQWWRGHRPVSRCWTHLSIKPLCPMGWQGWALILLRREREGRGDPGKRQSWRRERSKAVSKLFASRLFIWEMCWCH